MNESIEKAIQSIKYALDNLRGPHVQDNKHRMGALASGDIDRTVLMLESAERDLLDIAG